MGLHEARGMHLCVWGQYDRYARCSSACIGAGGAAGGWLVAGGISFVAPGFGPQRKVLCGSVDLTNLVLLSWSCRFADLLSSLRS
mmetsp:Transcript_2088/g.13482  ORF Transcript_2088/g.13482 Transcript_2088/m.13482 type:complete len:85 (-) Transcript_2088:1348-1602(-)